MKRRWCWHRWVKDRDLYRFSIVRDCRKCGKRQIKTLGAFGDGWNTLQREAKP